MKKLLFIANPLSGGIDKKKLLGQVERTIRHPYEVAFTERPGHATELARKSDADIVVAMGGDGTVNEVASGLIGTDKVLGIIPCGSGDGLALHLGISRKPHRAAKTLNDGIITEEDALEASDNPDSLRMNFEGIFLSADSGGIIGDRSI